MPKLAHRAGRLIGMATIHAAAMSAAYAAGIALILLRIDGYDYYHDAEQLGSAVDWSRHWWLRTLESRPAGSAIRYLNWDVRFLVIPPPLLAFP